MKYYNYVHINPDNEIFYAGKGCDKRAFSRFSRGKKWLDYVAEHGGFTGIIVEYYKTEEIALLEEINLIAKLKAMGYNLINILPGGKDPPNHTGMKRSDDTKRNISESLTGRTLSDDHIKSLVISHSDRTYEDIFGVEGAKIQKEKKRLQLIECNPNIKLTDVEILEMRRLYDSGELRSYVLLGNKFNCTKTNVFYIVKRKTWTHV